VLHIADEKPPQAHTLTNEARVVDERLVYRGDYLHIKWRLPMAKSSLTALLKRLDEARTQHGSVSEQHYLQLLTAAGRVDFGKDAPSLIRFHDVCLFLACFSAGATSVASS